MLSLVLLVLESDYQFERYFKHNKLSGKKICQLKKATNPYYNSYIRTKYLHTSHNNFIQNV